MGNREGFTKQDEEEDDEQLRPKQASSKLNHLIVTIVTGFTF